MPFPVSKIQNAFDADGKLGRRAGVSRYTLIALEEGDPMVSMGTVFETNTIVGIPLLAEDQCTLNKLATTVANLTGILPERGRRKKITLQDDF